MAEPVRVLQVVAKMERNGYESRIMDIYRNLDLDRIQFDFYTHRMDKGDFDDEIISMGGRVFYNNAINPIRFLRYLRELNSFFKAHHYDIVHSHLNTYSGWVLLVAKHNGVKVRIAHSRNTGFDPGWKSVFKWASKLIINIPPTHRFACSQKAGVWLFGGKFQKKEGSRVIPNAFDCDAFSYSSDVRKTVREELGLKDETAFVHVGRLTPQKNHAMLLSVFREFNRRHPASKLYLFGDGELQDQIQLQVSSLGISNQVVFMGNVPNVYKYLNGMDIMVFPSVYEGFGTVVIEAQCNGLPVLASDVLPEETAVTRLITYESLGKSVDAWVEDIECLLSSSERCDHSQEMKASGYDMRTNAKAMQSFYLESIS